MAKRKASTKKKDASRALGGMSGKAANALRGRAGQLRRLMPKSQFKKKTY